MQHILGFEMGAGYDYTIQGDYTAHSGTIRLKVDL